VQIFLPNIRQFVNEAARFGHHRGNTPPTVHPSIMKKFSAFLSAAIVFAAVEASAQAPAVVTTRDVKVDKIVPAMNKSPEFTVRNTTDKRATYLEWLEIEVEFSVDRVELVDELTFEYKVEINNKICPGEVTHINIPKGGNHYSVMYISPRTLERLMMPQGKKFNGAADVANIWVTIKKQGQVLATKSVKPGAARNLQEVPGALVPKSETPFQVLWWDRYEAVKTR
jgi:hypothetical protein